MLRKHMLSTVSNHKLLEGTFPIKRLIHSVSLRKLVYEIYRDFQEEKKMKISLEKFDVLKILAQNIHCGCT